VVHSPSIVERGLRTRLRGFEVSFTAMVWLTGTLD
jgi:hypothetical protein